MDAFPRVFVGARWVRACCAESAAAGPQELVDIQDNAEADRLARRQLDMLPEPALLLDARVAELADATESYVQIAKLLVAWPLPLPVGRRLGGVCVQAAVARGRALRGEAQRQWRWNGERKRYVSLA